MKILSINTIPMVKSNFQFQKNSLKSASKDISFSGVKITKNGKDANLSDLYNQLGFKVANNPSNVAIPSLQIVSKPSFKTISDGKLKDRTEFYQHIYAREYNEEPQKAAVDGVVVENNGQLRLVKEQTSIPYTGHRVRIKNNEVIEDISYSSGFPFYKTEYKDGDEYRLTQYDTKSQRRTWVYQKDGSFELSQYLSHKDKTAVELQMLNANGEKMAVCFSATKEPDSTGSCECSIPTADGQHKISLYWTYPNVKYSFYGNSQDAKSLKSVLQELHKVIHSNEYKEDFGSTSYLNRQLYDAIGYLSENIN